MKVSAKMEKEEGGKEPSKKVWKTIGFKGKEDKNTARQQGNTKFNPIRRHEILVGIQRRQRDVVSNSKSMLFVNSNGDVLNQLQGDLPQL